MARIVYQDEFITEYDDGTEEVRFTDEEWAVMLADPAYGYICQARKHRIDGGTRNWTPSEGCMGCFAEAEAAEWNDPDYAMEAAAEASWDAQFQADAAEDEWPF